MVTTLPAVKLEQFEGPFEVLLDLARKRKLDLNEVSLKQITDDFLGYIHSHAVPAATQGDFLVVASTLLLLKVRHLLPQLTPEEEEEVADLTGRLRLYQLYRDQAENLLRRWGSTRLYPASFWSEGVQETTHEEFPAIETDALRVAMSRIIEQLPKPAQPRAHLVQNHGRTLKECLSLFQDRLAQVKQFVFQDEVRGVSEKERAVSFLAVLEMAKGGNYDLNQDSLFSPLTVTRMQGNTSTYAPDDKTT